MSRLKLETPGLLAPRAHYELGDYPQAMAWHPTRPWLALAAISGRVVVVEVNRALPRFECSGHPSAALCLCWHPSGEKLWTGGADGAVREWDLNDSSPRRDMSLEKGWVTSIVWRPDGQVMAVACGRRLNWWHAQTESWTTARTLPSSIADVAWSPDDEHLAVAANGGVWIWRASAEEAARHFESPDAPTRVMWSPDVRFLVSADMGRCVHIWRISDGRPSRMTGFPGKVRALAWDATGRWLATSGGSDICVWDCSHPGPEDRDPILCQLGLKDVTAMSWSRDQSLLAAGYADGNVAFWQPTRCVYPVAHLNGRAPVVHAAWSPDECTLAIAHENGTVALL